MQYLRSEQVLNNILSIRIKIYMKERGCCLDHNSCIYQIKNKINGKKYIGQTSDFQKRKNSHLSALRRGKCFNSYLQRAFDVYGEDAFEFSILEYCDVDDLDKREEFWISREGSYFRGYNLNIGGCGKRGFHLSEETKEKIRCANKGRVVSKETKERMRKNHADFSGKNHPMYGIAWSDRFSKERQDIIREKMSEAQKGAKNHNYGKHISEEQKKKHSELMKEYYMKNENPMKNRKRPELSGERSYRAHSVICLNTSEYFSTVDAAAKAFGVSQSSISSCCSGKLYSAGKLKDGTPIVWKYREDVCGMKEEDIRDMLESILDIRRKNIDTAKNKTVMCVTTGEIFPSMTDACKKYKIDPSSLSKHLSGKRLHGGCGRHPVTKERLIWKRIDRTID